MVEHQEHKNRVYEISSCVVFNKTKERFGGLSNMAAGYPIEVNGKYIRTSEALYQLCRFPHMPEVQEMIILEKSPMTAKMRSKPFRKDTRDDWDQVKVNIMRWCLRAKLIQNRKKFLDLFDQTGDLPIVELSRKDSFWGAKPTEFETLTGMNVLGRLLMELRDKVSNGDFVFDKPLAPLTIDNFCIMNKPISFVLKERQLPLYGNDYCSHNQSEMF